MQPSRILRRISVAVLCAASASCFASDITVFNTIGPNNSYSTGQGWSVGGGSASGPTGANYVATNQFQAAASGALTTIELPMWRLQGSPTFTISILRDNFGTPGSALVTAIATAPDELSLITANFGGIASVESGSDYWISLSTSDPAAALWWSHNSIGVIGNTAFTGALWQQPGEWFYQTGTLGAARLMATAVPEPSAALLLAAGGLGLVLRWRFRPTH